MALSHIVRALPFLAALSVFAATAPEPPKLRLDETAAPKHYDVDLTVVPNKDTFTGKVDINVVFSQPRSVLWLNATALHIERATINGQAAQVLPGGKDFAGFSFPQAVNGPAKLHIEYGGKISRNSSAGIFQLPEGGNWYVYTQFEPTDARRAFPCFDEPSFKTPWQLTLHVPQSASAFGNYPQVLETPEGQDLKTVRFGETKPLPSYLVAFAVGPFETVSAGKVGKTPLRVIVPKGRTSEAKYAAESIPQLLKLLENYFGVPFAYPKLDSIVMPISNFAMENVGLITYGQSLLLAKPATDTLNRQRICAYVTAHEMAHQWFGDLVTTAWWNDIWLNEAFATWMERKIVAEWRPDWTVAVTAVGERLGAMDLDSLVSARRIRQPIVSNSDIANAFDGITYEKGAAVINMFESWIGPEKFRKGVQQYIRGNANGVATTPEFEAAISAAAGRDIAPAFNSFLDQPGVPVVSVALDCSGAKPRLQLRQKRSLPIGSPAAQQQSWRIPVCVKYDKGGGEAATACSVLADPRSDMTLTEARACPAWVLPNDGEKGYYRVGYEGDLLSKLLANHAAEITVAERVGVLGDVRSEVRTGDVPIATALKLVPEFANDPDRHVTESALAIAELTDSNFVDEKLRPKAREFIRKSFGGRATELGWTPQPGESDDHRLLREGLVAAVATRGEVQPLIHSATELTMKWFEDRSAIAPGMLGPVLDTAAQFGNADLFERLHAAAKSEKNPRVRETLLDALGSFRDPALAKRAMNLLLTKEFDARESMRALLFRPARDPRTEYLPFEFLRANLDALLANLPREVGGDFAANLPFVGRSFCDPEHRDQLQSFFGDKVKDYTGGERNLNQVLEGVNACIAQKQALEPQVAAFLTGF